MVITGTRKGIGAGLARYYSTRGYTVVGCSRTPSQSEGFVQIEADVSVEEDVRRLFALVRKRYGRLDALLNNAGIAGLNHALTTPASSLMRMLETNTLGTFLCCREGAKLMQRHKFGRIINFTTVAVPLRLAGEAAYAASKAAVESLTRVLAFEFAPLGITVNAVGPTPIDTDLLSGVTRDKLEALVARQALPRMGEIGDVANVVDFFLRPESDFVTGQVLYLGGV